VIFGLITFLIAAAFWQRRPLVMLVGAGVLFFYGGSLLWNILPSLNSPVSWEGHLSGAIAGIVIAWFSRDQAAIGAGERNLNDQEAPFEIPPSL
jgi:membrane associated rhomboid family serine protease